MMNTKDGCERGLQSGRLPIGTTSKGASEWGEASQAPCSSSRRRPKHSCDPACCFTLHAGQRLESAFVLGTLKMPQLVAVCGDGDHTQPVQDALVA